MLQPFNIEVVSQRELGIEDAVEDGLSFVENSLIKARHAARISGLPAIADDSGLCVAALHGAPGIYSARFSGEDATDASNISKLLHELHRLGATEANQRSAFFHCALTLVEHADDPRPIICEGSWHGEILTEPTGTEGFGYDPVFWVGSKNRSAAQLSREEKGALSHRGVALKKLVAQLADNEAI